MLRVIDPPPPFGANRVAWARPKLPEDERRARVLVPSFSRLSFSSVHGDTTRHDVTRCFTSAYETRKDDAHARADTQDAQRIFAGRRRVLLSRANCPSSAIPYILPSSRLLATPLRPLSTRRTASPFYPLSFILYPLYPGLPRQADASAPNGIMHRELVSYRLAVCLIFPIGPELRHARFPLPPPCVRVHHGVCMSPSLFHLLRSRPSPPLRSPVPFPSSLPLASCGATRPDKRV